jgi:hypothetical protein
MPSTTVIRRIATFDAMNTLLVLAAKVQRGSFSVAGGPACDEILHVVRCRGRHIRWGMCFEPASDGSQSLAPSRRCAKANMADLSPRLIGPFRGIHSVGPLGSAFRVWMERGRGFARMYSIAKGRRSGTPRMDNRDLSELYRRLPTYNAIPRYAFKRRVG